MDQVTEHISRTFSTLTGQASRHLHRCEHNTFYFFKPIATPVMHNNAQDTMSNVVKKKYKEVVY